MVQDELDLLRQTRTATLRIAGGLSQQQSDFTPAPRKWSVGEILDHLILAENLYRRVFSQLIDLRLSGRAAVVTNSFAEVNTSIAFIPASVMKFAEVPFTIFNMFVPGFVREAMTEFRLLPAQNPDIATPQKGKPIKELRDTLRSAYDQTVALFDANPTLDFSTMRYRHPLMGDNNVLQVLRIVSFHEKRHQSQIQDVMRSRNFPKAARDAA